MQAAATSNLGSKVGSGNNCSWGRGWLRWGGELRAREGPGCSIKPAGLPRPPALLPFPPQPKSDFGAPPPGTELWAPLCPPLAGLPHLSLPPLIGGGKARCLVVPEVRTEEERGSPAKEGLGLVASSCLRKPVRVSIHPLLIQRLGEGVQASRFRSRTESFSFPPTSPHPKILPSFGLDLLPKHMEPIERICMLTL